MGDEGDPDDCWEGGEQELGKQHQESLEVALSPCVVLISASVSSDQCGNYCDHDRQWD